MTFIFRLMAFFGLIFMTATLAVSGEQAAISTSRSDQSGVALTVYNSGLGLVKDQREVTLPSSASQLRFMDVAAKIIPASVSIRSITAPDRLRVLEQNYEYDLLNPQKLLDKYVGKEIKLYQKNPYSEREDIVNATLIANNGEPIYRIGNDITFGYPGRVIFPGVPENLIDQPTLVWLLETGDLTKQRIEANYLTEGISWRADYVLTLNEKDTLADLTGWATIDNQSGATYTNAQIKLVAGDINRVREQPKRVYQTMAVAATGAQFQEQGFFEYHIYSLGRPSTVKNNQSKQINLTSATVIPLVKEYLLQGAPNYYQGVYSEQILNQKVGVFIEFINRQAHNLGIPLPKGTVRVYKRDSDGALQFVGEDAIDHTPKDEKVRIKTGDAFDIVAIRHQTDWKKIASETYEAAFAVTLRNHKKEGIVIKVVEPIPGDWQMLSTSLPAVKGDAHTAVFQLPVPADGEAKLVYRVRMRY